MPLVGIDDPIMFELKKQGAQATPDNYSRMAEAMRLSGWKGGNAPFHMDKRPLANINLDYAEDGAISSQDLPPMNAAQPASPQGQGQPSTALSTSVARTASGSTGGGAAGSIAERLSPPSSPQDMSSMGMADSPEQGGSAAGLLGGVAAGGAAAGGAAALLKQAAGSIKAQPMAGKGMPAMPAMPGGQSAIPAPAGKPAISGPPEMLRLPAPQHGLAGPAAQGALPAPGGGGAPNGGGSGPYTIEYDVNDGSPSPRFNSYDEAKQFSYENGGKVVHSPNGAAATPISNRQAAMERMMQSAGGAQPVTGMDPMLGKSAGLSREELIKQMMQRAQSIKKIAR